MPGSTIVAPGELRPKQAGATVVCWLLGPDILPIAPSAHGGNVDLKFFYGRLNASQAYNSCAALARSIAASAIPRRAAKTSMTQGDTCSARPVEVAILTKQGLVTAARLVAAPALGPLRLKYACARIADGSLRISISGPPKGGLRGVLGSQLRLGVVRASNAQAHKATLSFYFGAPRPPR